MCERLASVEFSEGLEKISAGAFMESGIQSITLPSSMRIICGFAFARCDGLGRIQLNDELEALGLEE